MGEDQTVCVMSDSFDFYGLAASLQASGDLPQVEIVKVRAVLLLLFMSLLWLKSLLLLLSDTKSFLASSARAHSVRASK